MTKITSGELGNRSAPAYSCVVLVMLLTLLSLVLTVAIGGVFVVGLHRVVQWIVAAVEARGTTTTTEERELTTH